MKRKGSDPFAERVRGPHRQRFYALGAVLDVEADNARLLALAADYYARGRLSATIATLAVFIGVFDPVARVAGVEIKVRHCPLPQDDPRQRRPDITRAQKLLGWEPTVPLREGLKHTVEYFAERIKGREP